MDEQVSLAEHFFSDKLFYFFTVQFAWNITVIKTCYKTSKWSGYTGWLHKINKSYFLEESNYVKSKLPGKTEPQD